MSEIPYGDTKDLYGLTENPDGSIEIRVYHDNETIRGIIRENATNSKYFLSYTRFSGTQPRAKYHLAKIVRAYRSQFANNRVKFIL